MELLLFPETVATSGKGLLMFFVQPSWNSSSQPASLVGGWTTHVKHMIVKS